MTTVLLSIGVVAEAQQPTKIPRIGYLGTTSPSTSLARVEAFRQGLRELGYVVGENIIIEYRYAEGRVERLPTLAVQLTRLKVDVIVTGGPEPTRAAKQATSTIPIIMAQDTDPVGNGFVASLARPGGNITGLSALSPEISGKQLELLTEIVPKLSRLAVLWASNNPGIAPSLRELERAAGALEVKLQFLEILGREHIESALRRARDERANAVLVLTSGVAAANRKEIAGFAAKSRLPAIYPRREYVEDGGLTSYGASFTEMNRRAATYVDKILKGYKPADLPVEQPIKFEFIINLKAAKQIGLIIPPNVLARADRVIK